MAEGCGCVCGHTTLATSIGVGCTYVCTTSYTLSYIYSKHNTITKLGCLLLLSSVYVWIYP